VLRLKAPLASLAVLMIAVSGCSSSEGGGSSSTEGGELTGAAAEGLARAQEATEANLQEPTTIPVTEPLESTPPTGETFVWMKCGIPQCEIQGDALEQATAALGWNYEEIPWQDADPSTLVTGMRRALEFDPVAVGISGLPQALWQDVIPEYEAAGVKIVGNFNGPLEYDETVIGQAAAGATEQWAEIIANWVIADSGGSAQVALQTVNDIPVVKEFHDSFLATIEENCPGCAVTVVNNTIPQTGNGEVVGTVVAAVQRDPSIDYVVTGTGGQVFTGLAAALDAAGLGDQVKVGGGAGTPTNLTNVQAGTEDAYTLFPVSYTAWSMVDIVLRYMQDLDFDPDGNGGLPTQLLTQDVDFEISEDFNKPEDWQAQLEELWQVG
jgi:ribose transport system substrate-binding protein